MTVSVQTPLGYVQRGTFRPGQTIAEIYREQGLSPSVPVICVLNGKPLLRRRKRQNDFRRWEVRKAKATDLVEFVCPLRGDDAGKNILRTVALVGIAIAAAVVAGPVAGFIGIGGALGTAAVQAGIVIGGAFLLSVLVPVKPASADPNTGSAGAAASPTYSLTPTGNQARLLQPIPRLYGTHKLVPDFAAQAYSRYIGNEQYVYETFCLGLGRYDVHQVLIGDVVVYDQSLGGDGTTGRFTDIDISIKDPLAPMTLFTTAVDNSTEVANQEVRSFSIGPITLTGNLLTITPNESIGFSLLGFKSGDEAILTGASPNDGLYRIATVDSPGQLTLENMPNTSGFFPGSALSLKNLVGPYPACRSGRTTNTIEVDFVFPAGLGHIEDDGSMTTRTVQIDVQRRIIDDAGNPLSGFATVASYSYTAATRTAQRHSEVITGFGTNRIEIAINRSSNNVAIERTLNEVHWTGLKGFFTDDDQFPDVTIMQVKTRAGSELTSTGAQSFSVIQTAILPIYNGSSWVTPAATQSIAWAAADLLRNTTYGMGLPDSMLDIQRLYDLELTWSARGDTFNGVFDTQQSAWEALKSMLAAGRTKPVLVASIITFVRDQPSVLAKGVFTPRNIRRGTVEFTHILVDANTPDDVIVEFINEDTWKQDEVQCTLPGSTSTSPARVTLFGVTDQNQAQREGFFLAAGNAFRRVLVTFNTELEGKLLINGDTILVSHDVVQWAQSGEVAAYDGDAEITLSEPVTWAGGDQDFLVLSTSINEEWGPVLVRQKAGTLDVAVVDPGSRSIVEGSQGPLTSVAQFNREDTQTAARYVLGLGTTNLKFCKVISVIPQDMNTIQILAAVDDDRVYVN